MTLHSYALRLLLANSRHAKELPQPVRIADDWEERHIIDEDLKARLGASKVDEIAKKRTLMASDWETLDADDGGLKKPDPAFIGAWHEHRELYGYTLRAELVYRMKRCMIQSGI